MGVYVNLGMDVKSDMKFSGLTNDVIEVNSGNEGPTVPTKFTN